MADLSQNGAALDLYCGTGSIALHLARHAHKVYGIELVEDAVLNAKKNADRNHIGNVSFHCGDVQKILPTLALKTLDVIVIDPPRAGLTKKGVQHILAIDARQIVYVSCNPATLARDLAMLLEGGYTIHEVQPVDMFPHTSHIETVVDLRA